MKNGDKVKFGQKYCEETGRLDLLNKTIMLTPQYFEDDNGLYTSDREFPGIRNSQEDESDSIYHLFGNDLKNIHDCEILPATEEDLMLIQTLREEDRLALEKECEQMEEYLSKELKLKGWSIVESAKLTANDFVEMGFEKEEAESLLKSQEKLYVGATVGLVIDHHTDELLLESIENNGLDSESLVIREIEWKNVRFWFENTDGHASIGELKI